MLMPQTPDFEVMRSQQIVAIFQDKALRFRIAK